jgi:hypothetical protein
MVCRTHRLLGIIGAALFLLVADGSSQSLDKEACARLGHRWCDRGPISAQMSREVDQLLTKARSAGSADTAVRLWKRVLDINPRHAEALAEHAILILNDENLQEEGFKQFQLAFEPTAEPKPLDVHSFKGFTIAWHLGRRQTLEYADQKRFLLMAASSEHADDCVEMMLATLLPNHAESTEQAQLAVDEMHVRMDRLLAKRRLTLDGRISDNPWHVCMFGGFLAAVYYERNVKDTMEKVMQIGIKAVPSLIYVSPHLKRRRPLGPTGKVRIGFVSSHFRRPTHSVVECFGGMIVRLDRQLVEVTHRNRPLWPRLFITASSVPSEVAYRWWYRLVGHTDQHLRPAHPCRQLDHVHRPHGEERLSRD